MGSVDYRLVSAFVRRLRENAPAGEGRCARADVERLAALADGLRRPAGSGRASLELTPRRHR